MGRETLAERGLRRIAEAERKVSARLKREEQRRKLTPFQKKLVPGKEFRRAGLELFEETRGLGEFVVGELATKAGRKRFAKALPKGLTTAFITAPGATFKQAIVEPVSTPKGRAKTALALGITAGIAKALPVRGKAFKISGRAGTETVTRTIATKKAGKITITSIQGKRDIGRFTTFAKKAPKLSKTQDKLIAIQTTRAKISGKGLKAKTTIEGKIVQDIKANTIIKIVKTKRGGKIIRTKRVRITKKQLTPKEKRLFALAKKELKTKKKVVIEEQRRISVNLKPKKKPKILKKVKVPKKKKVSKPKRKVKSLKQIKEERLKNLAKARKAKKLKKRKPIKAFPGVRVRGGRRARQKQILEEDEFVSPFLKGREVARVPTKITPEARPRVVGVMPKVGVKVTPIKVTKPKAVSVTKPKVKVKPKVKPKIKPKRAVKPRRVILSKRAIRQRAIRVAKAKRIEKAKKKALAKQKQRAKLKRKARLKRKAITKPIRKKKGKRRVKKIKKRKKEKKGFDVFVKEKGKFKKVNKFPRTRTDAKAIGMFATDNTPSATFKLKKAKRKPIRKTKNKRTVQRLRRKFRKKKKNKFIEKRKHRIDTKGEKRGIPLKALRLRKLGLIESKKRKRRKVKPKARKRKLIGRKKKAVKKGKRFTRRKFKIKRKTKNNPRKKPIKRNQPNRKRRRIIRGR